MYPNIPLGRLLKDTRERQRLTLQEVAEKVGNSVQFVCDVESGRKSFPPAKLKPWSAALGLIPDVIVAHLISHELDRISRCSKYPLDYDVTPKARTGTLNWYPTGKKG